DPGRRQPGPGGHDDLAAGDVLPHRTDVPAVAGGLGHGGETDRRRGRAGRFRIGEINGHDRLGGGGHRGSRHHTHSASRRQRCGFVSGGGVTDDGDLLSASGRCHGRLVEGESVHRRGGELRYGTDGDDV